MQRGRSVGGGEPSEEVPAPLIDAHTPCSPPHFLPFYSLLPLKPHPGLALTTQLTARIGGNILAALEGTANTCDDRGR